MRPVGHVQGLPLGLGSRRGSLPLEEGIEIARLDSLPAACFPIGARQSRVAEHRIMPISIASAV
eukprot:8277561-Pyramimonas_sp.AAC.1